MPFWMPGISRDYDLFNLESSPSKHCSNSTPTTRAKRRAQLSTSSSSSTETGKKPSTSPKRESAPVIGKSLQHQSPPKSNPEHGVNLTVSSQNPQPFRHDTVKAKEEVQAEPDSHRLRKPPRKRPYESKQSLPFTEKRTPVLDSRGLKKQKVDVHDVKLHADLESRQLTKARNEDRLQATKELALLRSTFTGTQPQDSKPSARKSTIRDCTHTFASQAANEQPESQNTITLIRDVVAQLLEQSQQSVVFGDKQHTQTAVRRLGAASEQANPNL